MLNRVTGQKVIHKMEVFFIFKNNFLKFAATCSLPAPILLHYFTSYFPVF